MEKNHSMWVGLDAHKKSINVAIVPAGTQAPERALQLEVAGMLDLVAYDEDSETNPSDGYPDGARHPGLAPPDRRQRHRAVRVRDRAITRRALLSMPGHRRLRFLSGPRRGLPRGSTLERGGRVGRP